MNKLSHQKIWLFLGMIFVIITYIICLIPIKSSGEGIPHFDKVIHFLIYFVLGFWFLLSFELKFLPKVLVGLIAMGVSIELLQGLTPSRSFDYFDIMANSFGCFAGLFFAKNIFSELFIKIEGLLKKLLNK